MGCYLSTICLFLAEILYDLWGISRYCLGDIMEYHNQQEKLSKVEMDTCQISWCFTFPHSMKKRQCDNSHVDNKNNDRTIYFIFQEC